MKRQQPEALRHGDVLIQPVAQMTDFGAEVERDPDGAVVFARGEKTGHRHFLRERDVRLFEVAGDPTVRICRVGGGGAVVRHEEHGDLHLPPGDYRISQKRQYEAENGWEPVSD